MPSDERVTLRLSAEDVRDLDIFVEAREFSNRSDVIRKAIREYVANNASKLKAQVEARKQLKETLYSVVADRAEIAEADEQNKKLMSK